MAKTTIDQVRARLESMARALNAALAVVDPDVGDAAVSTGEFRENRVLYVVEDFSQLDDETFDTQAVLERLTTAPGRGFVLIAWQGPDRVQFAVLVSPTDLQAICQHMLLYHDQMEGCQERLA